MKSSFRALLSPILKLFESGEGPYNYKKSHRTILNVVGCLFILLSLVTVAGGLASSLMGAIIPFLVFFLGGLLCLVIGTLGTDRAVAKIWGTK
ncbi:hypothetical protein GCM10009133_39220 [Cocleimonas flava]|uniref:Uncharacterized protein n=1 Tax=Cocleimonas flava TaxID=634765 RepID=A0A4R1F4G8_9GAMM|nr:hypothetical protein [Cocleimonas flava]TCJ88240.1 hypothetical protein EV695_0080 [Cocleimonas flava]